MIVPMTKMLAGEGSVRVPIDRVQWSDLPKMNSIIPPPALKKSPIRFPARAKIDCIAERVVWMMLAKTSTIDWRRSLNALTTDGMLRCGGERLGSEWGGSPQSSGGV